MADPTTTTGGVRCHDADACGMTEIELALVQKALDRVGIKSLLNHGAGSLVWSEGVEGVTQDNLLAYTREIALHCAVALSAPQPADAPPDGWMPIETAPKDGTHVLVVVMTSEEPSADIAHWADGQWRAGTDDCWEDAHGKGGSILGYYDDATHWRPLPAPPTINASKRD